MLLAHGATRTSPVKMEYAAEASYAPLVALVQDGWKYTRCGLDPEQLFHLESDPNEQHNLADKSKYAKKLQFFQALADKEWDLARFDADVRQSQARRKVVYEALRNGVYYPWDYQPLQQASERYMRNHKDLNILESNQRYPK